MHQVELTPKTLTAKEQRFTEEYIKDLNATRAAKAAGYSAKSAANIGWELVRKAHVKAAIETHLAAAGLSSDETKKLISDIAKSSINDFFRIVEVEHTPKVKKPALTVIQDLQRQLDFEEAYAQKAAITGEELTAHQQAQQARRRQIIRLELQLKENPAAVLSVDGEPELRKTVELDLVKLVEARETGRIKTITPTEHGYKVELYPADVALANLARIHGLFSDKVKHEHSGEIERVVIFQLPDNGR